MKQRVWMKKGVAIASLCLLSACADSSEHDPAAEEEAGATGHRHEPLPESGVARYQATGTVEFIDEESGRVTIDHDEIAGFMGPMTMRFEVRDPRLLETLEAGMDVRFRVVVEGESFYIDQIAPGSRK